MDRNRRKTRRKALRRVIRMTLRKKSFWIDCAIIYTSILAATIFVQAIILHIGIALLMLCIGKSMLTTIINVLFVMIFRRQKAVRKNWPLKIVTYAISSMPYVEITMLTFIIQDYALSLDMIQWYAMTYLFMGIFIEGYFKAMKKIITKKTGKKPAYFGSGFFI